MSTKTKNIDKPIVGKLTDIAQQAGIILMTAAVTLGMLEMPEHSKRVIVPNQPAPEFAENGNETNPDSSALRREREETGPHYVSYNVTQRTPGRTGKW